MKNENNKTLEKYKNLAFLIKFYCFQEELKNRINKAQKENKSYTVYFLKKKTMVTYKNIFDYSKLSTILQNKKGEILKDIKDNEEINYDKLNDSILSNIIEKLPNDYLKKIDKLDNKKLNKIEKEDKSVNFIHKYIEYKNENENKIVRLKIFKDFDLIDYNINSLDMKLQIEMKLGECFILSEKKILFYYKDDDFLYEIVNVDKNLDMKIEYLFNKYEINSSKDFSDYLFKNGISNLIKTFNNKNEINNIIINYDKSKENIRTNWYKYNEKNAKNMVNENIVDEESIMQEVKENKDISKIIKNIKYILKEIKIKYKSKKDYNCDEKLKSLILLLIYQKILNQSLSKNDLKNGKEFKEIFLINKKCLEKIDYFKVKKIIEDKINMNELPLLDNNIVNKYEGELNKLKNIIINLDEEELKELKNIENEIKKNKSESKDEFEEITIYNNKKLKIYDQFLLVDISLYYYFKRNFKINADEQNYLFKFVNQKAILKPKYNAQSMLFIVNFSPKQCSIEYILDYNKSEYLEEEYNDFIESGFEEYFNKKFMFNKEAYKNDAISPIISKEKIIGYGYKYSSNVKEYINGQNLQNYLKNEKTTLMKLLSLYSYYKKIEEKLKNNSNNDNNEKYYLINEDFLINLKVESGYKLIYDDLEEHLKNNNIEKFENDIFKNVYLCLKALPEDIIKKYFKKEFDANSKLDKNNIEPKVNIYNFKKKESVNIFTNFEIIESKIIENFIGKLDNDNILSECYFNNGKIIINMPNHLNKDIFVSLIGVLDIYSKYFITEYILIYNFEDVRQTHLTSISNRLDTYINSLHFKNNSSSITLESSPNVVGTIIKYNGGEENNNKSNNNGEIQIDYDFNTDKPYIKDNFSSSPKIGLQNIGATCYMNSTLQCFSHIDKFVEYFKYNKERIDILKEEKTLSNSFKILIENLWPNNFDPNKSKNCYAPYNFKDKISSMNPLFKGVAANDAKDLVNFIIMKLHLELNKPDKDDDNQVSIINDQKNKELLYINYLRETESNNKSIISNLFYAINYNKTRCLSCGTELFNFQTYFFIIFPLEEVRKYNSSKNQSNMNIVNYNNSANISSMPSQNQINNNFLNMPQNQANNNFVNMQQNQANNNFVNMQQNQVNNNYMNMPQSQVNNNFVNLSQSQMNNNYMNVPQNYINNPQYSMNMGMYNTNNQNNIINNNGMSINMSMNMLQTPMAYNCNPQYNNNSSNINQLYNATNMQQIQNENQSINNINSNEVSIIDCFEYDKRDNEMSGDNAMYCSHCKAKCPSIMNTILETGPEVLIILLNRGKGLEFDVKKKFGENLDLEKYIESEKDSRKYKLIGVITHIGDSSMDGHFISYCREPFENGEWNKYNDAFVTKVGDFKKEVIDFAMPYVLFYQRENKK